MEKMTKSLNDMRRNSLEGIWEISVLDKETEHDGNILLTFILKIYKFCVTAVGESD